MSKPLPTPEEIRNYLKQHKLSGSDAARIVGVDSRTMRRYMSDADVKSHLAMPYAVWFTLTTQVEGKKDCSDDD